VLVDDVEVLVDDVVVLVAVLVVVLVVVLESSPSLDNSPLKPLKQLESARRQQDNKLNPRNFF